MIEQVLYEHLIAQEDLAAHLTQYNCRPAIFNQEAPADMDEGWACGPQYGRIVFAVNAQGDPERFMSGLLTVDILCKEDEQYPEDIEPLVRAYIHGWFFSNGTFTVAAQWRASDPFTQETDHVTGCTVTFELLGFPVLTTFNPDVIERINQWTKETYENIHVINHDALPAPAWRPTGDVSAVYWRLVRETPAGWIPDTFSTNWRTATVKCHIFSKDNATAAIVARDLTIRLHAIKRLLKEGETPIMVNRKNTADLSADPLRAGQVTVEATYGVIVHFAPTNMLQHINKREETP